jgi:hypothetical protein
MDEWQMRWAERFLDAAGWPLDKTWWLRPKALDEIAEVSWLEWLWEQG